MKENKIEKLQDRLEELHRIQEARLACGADDLDIIEEISEVEAEIKELEDDINEENNNGNDINVGSIGNSIEEDIKNAEHFIDSIKTDKEYKEENGWHGYYNKEIVELTRILEHILSDYKRVLKENEQLRTEVNSLKEKLDEINKIDFPIIN